MTPAARIAAAIEILDQHLAGTPAEKALTAWARRARFAGSKDRAAIRDHVFDALRRKRSLAALGGAMTGRGLMLGALKAGGQDPQDLFTGQGHAPAPLTAQEQAAGAPPQGLAALDCPDWLAPQLQASLGADFEPVCTALQHRAPVWLRVNSAKATRQQAAESLAADGIATRPSDQSNFALEVTENPRKLQSSKAYQEGLVELQDLGSQILVDLLPLGAGMRVLDYCAGGGGKLLAMGARADLTLYAHDAAPRRMRDLSARAARAGLSPSVLETNQVAGTGPYDLVLCDAPCSGSGAWRRAPEGKWALTPERLLDLQGIQSEILSETAPYVAKLGSLAYMTCSLLQAENDDRIDAFLSAHPDWHCTLRHRLTPLDGSDGFFVALLSRR